jgi:membrane protein DedA with SNARE-associated domain
MSDLLQRHGAPVLVVTRGVPVLAEASIMAAGVLGMAPLRCFAAATIGNLGVAAVHAYLGATAAETSAAWAFAAIILVPGLMLAAATGIRWTVARMSGGEARRAGQAP